MAETITATEIISLYSLTPTRVVVEKLRRITQDGVVYTEKAPARRIYYNAPYDRSLMEEELPQPYLAAVQAIFGEVPLLGDASTLSEEESAV